MSDVSDSTPNANGPDGPDGPDDTGGDMGVSSERVGHAGPGQVSTDGLRDTTPVELPDDADVAPDRAAGEPEQNPEGIAPKAGYSSKDPRSD